MASDQTHQRPRFDSTQWSLVLQAQRTSSPDAPAALAQLCEQYWFPLYAYVRSLGKDIHQAQDLTQGFFAQLIEKNYVGDADPSRGKFRTFLLTSLNHFLANEYDKKTAIKRGGSRTQFSLQFDHAEQQYLIEPISNDQPESRFQRQWARTLLQRVIDRLHDEYISSKRALLFENLKQFLVAGDTEPTGEIASRLGISESAVRVAAHRLRSRYRDLLRVEIAATVNDPDDIDAEIAELFAAFSVTS